MCYSAQVRADHRAFVRMFGAEVSLRQFVELFYRRRVESVVERVTGTLETVAILGMGVAVSVILCAIYLPLFSMASGV